MRFLGIGGLDHNGAVALIEDGRIKAFLEAERVLRRKNIGMLDVSILRECLDRLGVAHVDAIGVTDTTFWPERSADFTSMLSARFACQNIMVFDHHAAHAACAFATSEFAESACVVLDGKGDGTSASIWRMRRDREAECLLRVASAHSLGRIWWGVSDFCGLPGHHSAGKTMALAAYGTPAPIFAPHLELREDGGFAFLPNDEHRDTFRQVPRIVEWLSRRFAMAPGQFHADAAASVQALTETIVAHMVSCSVAQTGQSAVCLAGGVALNGLANQLLLRNGIVRSLHVPPCTDDRGLAIGAAALVAQSCGEPVKVQSSPMSPFLGPAPREGNLQGWSRCEGNPNELIAGWLRNRHAVAVFCGADECGPRALGHRSIIASPVFEGTRERMNLLKKREYFRPFGCSILADQASDWFELEGPSPYMLRIASVRPNRAQLIPGVLHVDGTSRIQTVHRNDGSGLWALLEHLARTGHPPLLLNTSLNLAGHPLVHSLTDAADACRALQIDHLIINGVPHVHAH